MGIMDAFSSRLKELRDASGLNQEQLAKELGVSRGSISFYENGDRIPDIEFLFQMSKFFDVSADWLLGLSKAKNSNIDVQALCSKTGLSEEISAYLLQNHGNMQTVTFARFAPISCFNRLFHPEQFHAFLVTLCVYFYNIDSIRKICSIAESEIADIKMNGNEESLDDCCDRWFEKIQSAHKEYKYSRFDTIDFFTKLLNSIEDREGIENLVDDLINLCLEGTSQE